MIDIRWVLGITCIAGIVGMVLLVVVYSIVIAGSRSKALKEKADEYGFTYEPYDHKQHFLPWVKQSPRARALLGEAQLFPLFALGQRQRRQVYNLIGGTVEGINFLQFDHLWYGVGRAKPRSGKGARQTVLRLELPGGNLPGFCLRPGSKPIFYTFISDFKQISLESTHPLASRYWLQGDDPVRILTILDDEVLDWLAGSDGMSLEGRGQYLMLYRRPHLVSPEGMGAFLQQGVDLLKIIERKLGVV